MIYLDNSATSRKKSLGVIYITLREIILSANAGRSGHKASIRTALKIEETREIVQKYFFAGNVIFTKNCTEALNLGIIGSELNGHVVTTIYEHNSVLRTLKSLEKKKRISLSIVKPENGLIEKSIIKAIKSDTQLVVISGISNVTGEKFNVERISKKIKEISKSIVLLDMAQGAGHMKISYDCIDMIACSGHKGLGGVQGTGFLLCKKFIKLNPIIIGGTGTSSNVIDIPKIIPEGMEAGTLNAPGIISLGYAIERTYKNFNKINAKIFKLTNYFYAELKKIKGIKVYAGNNGIVLMNFDKFSCGEACDILSSKYGIYARSGLHCAPLAHQFLGTTPNGAVRFGIGENNNLYQIKKTIFAIKDMVESVTKARNS